MEQKKISQGFLVAGKELGTITLPEDFLDNLKEKAGVFLVLFIPQEDRTKITIIPYSGTELIKVIVHLITFSPHTIRTIADIIQSLQLKTVHTSGICLHDDECCYEAYIETPKERNLDTIRERFLSIEGATIVEIELIELS